MKNIIIIKCFLLSALFYACDSASNKGLSEFLPKHDSTNNNIVVPGVFTNANDKGFNFHADTLYLNNTHYSGWVYKLNEIKDTIFMGGYFNGIEEGIQKKWYYNKQIAEERLFHLGKKIGKHIGFWENGNPKFEYYFLNGEHQGIAKEWYNNGKPYRSFHYENGYEEGSQRMWWENGTVRANYVVKNGRRYGLIGLKLCMNQNDSLKK